MPRLGIRGRLTREERSTLAAPPPKKRLTESPKRLGRAMSRPRSASGWVGLQTMIGSAAVHVLWRSTAAALLGLSLLLGPSLLLGLAAPNEAHAQQGCQVGTAKHRAGLKFDYHRQWSDGKFTVAKAAYRALIALGETTLPAWTGANISGNAPTTAISVTDLKNVLESEGLNPQEPNGWRIITSELACVERGLPAITISGGPAVTEGADAQFTVNVSRASGSAMAVNLTVADVAGSDFVASGNEGSQTVSIPANQTSVTFPVPTVKDESDEANGYVMVTVVGGGVGDGYTMGATTMARVRVSDSSAGQVFVSNIRQTSGGSPGNFNFERAQAFTTGSRKPGYTVKSVDILFAENSLDDLFRISNPRLTVTIRNESGGNPGTTVVGTLNLPRSSPTFDSFRTMTFRAPAKGIKLSPSTTYFLVINPAESGSPGRDAKLRLVASDAEDAGGAAGFSIGNQSLYYASWNNSWTSANSWRVSVKGEPNPFTDVVQMSNETRRVAEWGYSASVYVEVGDGLALHSSPRSINYTTGGTATRGSGKDYTIDGCTGSTCSVKLRGNTKSAPIIIRLNDDGIDEGDETIVITLQDGEYYTVNKDRNTTTVTLPDNDTRGLYFSRSWADVDEGASHTYTVKLRSQPTAAVTVNIASDNPDVTVTPTSLTFNPSGSNLWSRARSVTVDAAQDSDAVDDTAILTHTTSGGDYGGANALSIGRQVEVDDDEPGTTTPVTQLPIISITGGAAVTEGTPASFTVNASPVPTSSLTVNVQVLEVPSQDFVAAGQERVRTVFLNAGATSTTFFVPTVNDNTDEDDGSVYTFVNDGTGYVAGGGSVVTILDNDYQTPAVSFSAESGGDREDDGTHEARVYLTHPAPPGGITLLYHVSGTATRGNSADYTVPNTVTVNAGERSAAIPVAINDDSSFEEDAETVILTLIGGGRYTLGSTTVYTLTITDNDVSEQPSLIFVSPYSNAHEDDGIHEVFVDLRNPAPFDGITISYTVSGTATAGSGNDFTIQDSGTLEVWGGATGAAIPIAINNDSSEESPETVILTLTGAAGYTLGDATSHAVTIYDAGEGFTSADLNPSGGTTLPEGTDITFSANFKFNKQLPPGGVATLPLTIWGTATLGTDYRLTCGEGKSGVVITCSGLNGNGPASITFDGSRSSRTVRSFGGALDLEILEDNTSESDETLTLRLGRGSPRTITITDAPSSVAVSFNRATYSIGEGAGNIQLIYTVTPASGRALTIPLIYTDVTATGGVDYTSTSQAVLKANGTTTQSHPPFTPILEDAVVEGDETFRVAIDTANLPAGVTAGSITEVTITIEDNDNLPASPSQASPTPTPAQAPAPTPTPTPTPQACNLPADAITVTEVTGWRDALDPNRAAAGIKRWNRVLEAFSVDTGAGVSPMSATLAREVANWLKNDRWDRTSRTLEAMAQCDG